MTAADIPAVHTLERQLFPLDAWSEQVFRRGLEDALSAYWVSYVGADRVVGYAGVGWGGGAADIHTVTVEPAFWGRRIGRTLMELLVERARAQGALEVFLEVRADNARARELYGRLGFLPVGCRRRYYADGVDAVVMRLSLEQAPGVGS